MMLIAIFASIEFGFYAQRRLCAPMRLLFQIAELGLNCVEKFAVA
jgi:hypothetical protein